MITKDILAKNLMDSMKPGSTGFDFGNAVYKSIMDNINVSFTGTVTTPPGVTSPITFPGRITGIVVMPPLSPDFNVFVTTLLGQMGALVVIGDPAVVTGAMLPPTLFLPAILTGVILQAGAPKDPEKGQKEAMENFAEQLVNLMNLNLNRAGAFAGAPTAVPVNVIAAVPSYS